MKPWLHAKSSAKKFGGKPEDYLAIHDRMDSTKSSEASVKHRCVFHSAFGIFIIEEIFGTNITNSDGKEVSVRDVAEQHVLEDLGTIPSLSDWLKELPIRDWMGPPKKKAVEEKLFEPPVQQPSPIAPAVPILPINIPPNFPRGFDVID